MGCQRLDAGWVRSALICSDGRLRTLHALAVLYTSQRPQLHGHQDLHASGCARWQAMVSKSSFSQPGTPRQALTLRLNVDWSSWTRFMFTVAWDWVWRTKNKKKTKKTRERQRGNSPKVSTCTYTWLVSWSFKFTSHRCMSTSSGIEKIILIDIYLQTLSDWITLLLSWRPLLSCALMIFFSFFFFFFLFLSFLLSLVFVFWKVNRLSYRTYQGLGVRSQDEYLTYDTYSIWWSAEILT